MTQRLHDAGTLLVRVAASILMLSHGIPKAMKYTELIQEFPDPLGVGTEMSAMLIIFAEVGCAVLVLIGFLTRFAAATVAGAMLVAGLVHHFSDPFSAKELSLVYALLFGTIALIGPGPRSIDGWIASSLRRVVRKSPPEEEPALNETVAERYPTFRHEEEEH